MTIAVKIKRIDCNIILIQTEGEKNYPSFNPDIFHLILIYCYEVNSVQHESNYISYIQTKCCKPLATLITSSFIPTEDSSWLFLSFHILYAYYLIFF